MTDPDEGGFFGEGLKNKEPSQDDLGPTYEEKHIFKERETPKKPKFGTNNYCGWLAMIGTSRDPSPARFCVLGKISALSYKNVSKLLGDFESNSSDELLGDIATVMISPRKYMVFFETVEDAFLPTSNVLDIINIERVKVDIITHRSFKINRNGVEEIYLVQYPQSAEEWVERINYIKNEIDSVNQNEKRSQMAFILKKIKRNQIQKTKKRGRKRTANEGSEDYKGKIRKSSQKKQTNGTAKNSKIFDKILFMFKPGREEKKEDIVSEKTGRKTNNKMQKKRFPLEIPFEECTDTFESISDAIVGPHDEYVLAPIKTRKNVTSSKKYAALVGTIHSNNEHSYQSVMPKYDEKTNEFPLTPPETSEASSDNGGTKNVEKYLVNSAARDVKISPKLKTLVSFGEDNNKNIDNTSTDSGSISEKKLSLDGGNNSSSKEVELTTKLVKKQELNDSSKTQSEVVKTQGIRFTSRSNGPSNAETNSKKESNSDKPGFFGTLFSKRTAKPDAEKKDCKANTSTKKSTKKEIKRCTEIIPVHKLGALEIISSVFFGRIGNIPRKKKLFGSNKEAAQSQKAVDGAPKCDSEESPPAEKKNLVKDKTKNMISSFYFTQSCLKNTFIARMIAETKSFSLMGSHGESKKASEKIKETELLEKLSEEGEFNEEVALSEKKVECEERVENEETKVKEEKKEIKEELIEQSNSEGPQQEELPSKINTEGCYRECYISDSELIVSELEDSTHESKNYSQNEFDDEMVIKPESAYSCANHNEKYGRDSLFCGDLDIDRASNMTIEVPQIGISFKK